MIAKLIKRALHRLNRGKEPTGGNLPPVLRKYLNAAQPLILMDIGAHDGAFTNEIDSYSGVAQAVLVEALPHKAASLRANFTKPRFDVFECALADRAGEAEFHVNEFEPTASLFEIRRDLSELAGVELGCEKVIRVPVRTADEIIAGLGIKHFDLVKIDVQGAEMLVLASAAELLQCTRMIWIEVSFRQLYKTSATFTEVYAFLDRHGFRLMDFQPAFRSPQGELLQSDALFLKP